MDSRLPEPAAMDATTLATDLAKAVFELKLADAHGRIIERKRLSRSAFFRCLANADNNSDLRGRLNTRHRFATFMMARALRAHRKAG
jgi:hypothetical protein